MTQTQNVIRFNPADFFCARQCKESIKWCTEQDRKNKSDVHAVEIKGEQELYKLFLNKIVGRAA